VEGIFSVECGGLSVEGIFSVECGGLSVEFGVWRSELSFQFSGFRFQISVEVAFH